MKRIVRIILLSISTAVVLTGCLDVEGVHMRMDLKNRVGEVMYRNLVSDSKDDETVRADFNGLIKIAYSIEGLQDDDPAVSETVLRELYESDGRLDGRIKFVIKDAQKALRKYGFKTNEAGDFFIDLSDEDIVHSIGNGEYVETDSEKRMVWSRDASLIEIEVKGKFRGEATNLLPYWKAWKEEGEPLKPAEEFK